MKTNNHKKMHKLKDEVLITWSDAPGITATRTILQQLVDWLREKIESGRISFEDDAPYLEGMIEEIEAFLKS